LFNVLVTENVGVYTGIEKPCGVSDATDAFKVVAVPEHIGEAGDDVIVIVGGASDTVAIVVNWLEHPLLVAVRVKTPLEVKPGPAT
jgi:hypothetical protein